MKDNLFKIRPEVKPKLYVYEIPNESSRAGLIKVGYTTRDVRERIKEQLQTSGVGYKILLEESSIRNDGTTFNDHVVHDYLKRKGFRNVDGEWFNCNVKDVKAAIIAIRNNRENIENRTKTFQMRPEQEEAVEKAYKYFTQNKGETHFLWNAKMRFGKTFATYQLAKKMNAKKVLVLTFKPAVEDSWEKDLSSHVDFEGWQFFSRKSPLEFEDLDMQKPIVCFGSFQDYLGKKNGGIKPRNKWVHAVNWDLIVFDEYHFGAWGDRAQELFDPSDPQDLSNEEKENERITESIYEQGVKFAHDIMPITTDHYLYLSGTPFRALSNGEFIEEQIYNWTYSDEQQAKEEWEGDDNPYRFLPKMVMMTYQMPDSIKHIAEGGEFDEFDLNTFFAAEKNENGEYQFLYKDYIQKWLDLIRGGYLPTAIDELKLNKDKPPFPFSDARLLNILTHTFWFLPSVASCYAMRDLLKERQNIFYHDYKVITAAGPQAGIGLDAITPVREAMANPLETKTITLSTGKLTTGVTIRPWSGVFMLRNLKSPETYFQTAFRVQNSWVIENPDGKNPNEKESLKEVCYIFDFAPNRALSQIAEYSSELNVEERDPEKKVADFIKFLPILAYDGSSMKEIDAIGVLDMAMSGTTATLLARRWESALLVNVDNETLARLLGNDEAMNILMNIEGFRSLNKDLETIINKSESIKKLKQKASEKDLTKKEKKELTDEEREYRSKRKEIQQKLIKFATRIPVFMYLTDYREKTLRDVITKLEPQLFKKVTGLTVEDFELLMSFNIFNSGLMNDAVWKFKRYEDSSLQYTGINKHEGEKVGGFDTVISEEEHKSYR
jgi:hypothetical protein